MGYIDVPPAGYAFQAEVGRGITFVITGGNVRQLIKLPAVIFGFYDCFMKRKPYMLALVGRPSLHGYDACVVYWATGALRRNCRQKQRKTFFL